LGKYRQQAKTLNVRINRTLDDLLKNDIPRIDIPGSKSGERAMLVWEQIELNNGTIRIADNRGKSSGFQMNPPLVALFREIEKQSHEVFIYPDNLSPVWQIIDLKEARIIANGETTGRLFEYAVTPVLSAKFTKLNMCVSSPTYFFFVCLVDNRFFQDYEKLAFVEVKREFKGCYQ